MRFKETPPLVTIIALCYNHELYLEESLGSLFNQTYKNLEIIIVNDASKDNSSVVIQKIIKDKHEITFIDNSTNLGNTTSFNKALKIAQGDYIIDFATDDILLPSFIEEQINYFTHSPLKKLGIVFTNVEMIDEHQQHLHYHFKVDDQQKAIQPPPVGMIYRHILKEYLYNSCGMMMKKEVLDELGGYDQKLAYEDLDFLFRASKTYEIGYIDKILVQKLVLKTSLTTFFYKNCSKSKRLRNSTYKICKKAYQQNSKVSENWALLFRIKQMLRLTVTSKHYSLSLKYLLFAVQIMFKNIRLRLS